MKERREGRWQGKGRKTKIGWDRDGKELREERVGKRG